MDDQLEKQQPWALNFKLTKPARKSGGDKYEAKPNITEKPVVFYLPQFISRPTGAPENELEIIVKYKRS